MPEHYAAKYVITNTPDAVDKEGGFYKIALIANNKDLQVVTREIGAIGTIDWPRAELCTPGISILRKY